MKKIITCIVLGLLLSVSSKIIAGHGVGGNLAYKYIGNDSIEITLTAYRNCNGITLSNPPVTISNGCTTQSITLGLVSKRDITGVGPNCSVASRCTGSYTYGFEEHIFIGRVSLGSLNTSCCNYTISWGLCCRNGAITTGAANSNFYIETKFNRCLAPNNTSPVFQSSPKFLIPLGQDQSISFKANDADGDRLTYELTDPLSASGSPIGYSGQWKATMPTTFLGFPNTQLAHPAGFRLDSLTGNIYFRPVKKDEYTVMVMKVTEWRKIGGTYTKIGETRQDVEALIVNTSNKGPIINDSTFSQLKRCGSGGAFCTDIKITDADTADTLSIAYKHQLKNISFTNIGTPKKPIIRVCYTPDSAEIASGKQLAFTIEAKDNACPLPGFTEKTYIITLGQNMPDSFALVQNVSCGAISLGFVNKSATITDATPVLEITHNGQPVALDKTNKTISITKPGWYYTKLTVQSPTYCDTRVYTDSIALSPANFFNVDAGPAQTVCGPAQPTLSVAITGGTAPFRYLWSTGTADTLPRVTFLPSSLGKKNYNVTVVDSNGCVKTDSVEVGYYYPKVTLSGTEKQCNGRGIQLQAALSDTVSPLYNWGGFTQNKANLSVTADLSAGGYTFILDDNGCAVTKQWQVTVYDPTLNLSHPTKFCLGDTVILSATAGGGLPPYGIFWNTYLLSGSSINRGPLASGTYTYTATVTDAFGCSSQKTNSYTVSQLPQIFISLPSIVCESATPINLENYVFPQQGQWSGPGVVGNYFYPNRGGSGLQTLNYAYTDNTTGCSATKTTNTLIDVQPIASFTVDSVKGPKGYSFRFTNTSKMGGLNYATWNFGDPNSGANNTIVYPNPIHTFSDTGKYTVKLLISGGFCPPDSITKANYIFVYLNTLSVSEKVNNNVIIYPNPAQNNVSIESGFEIKHLWLTDMLGRNVYPAYTTDTYTAQIHLSSVAPGTYLLNVESKEGQRSSAKLIITR